MILFNLLTQLSFAASREELVDLISSTKVNGDGTVPKVSHITLEILPQLLVAQLYIMMLTDIVWWKLSLNFGFVWLIHFH